MNDLFEGPNDSANDFDHYHDEFEIGKLEDFAVIAASAVFMFIRTLLFIFRNMKKKLLSFLTINN